MSLGGAGDPASPAEVKDGPARVEDGRICASAARRSAAGMDKLPPWLVVTSPVRASSSSTAMVSSTVAGVPPASGRLPERRSRRPASSSASCRRCPGVRVSGSPSSAGTGRLSCREPVVHTAAASPVSWACRRPDPSGNRVRIASRCRSWSRSEASARPGPGRRRFGGQHRELIWIDGAGLLQQGGFDLSDQLRVLIDHPVG